MVRCSVVVLTDNPGASLAGPWQWRGRGNLKLRQTQGLMTEARRFPAPWSQGDAGANIFSMLEEHEVALALAELHVKHADAFPISRRRLRGSKASVKAHWRLNKSSDYLKRTF